MRIRQSITQSFALLALPAVTMSAVIYFGLFGIFGPQGLLALADSKAQLGLARATLRQTADERLQLAHRVALMEKPEGDPDLIEELARKVLMDGAHNQVAVPRIAR